MRAVLTYLLTNNITKFEVEEDLENVVLALIYVRDRLMIPRDMKIWAGKRLRDAIDKVAKFNNSMNQNSYLNGLEVNKYRY